MTNKIAYVFFNGELLGSKDFFLKNIDFNSGDIYCADGGANHLEYLGLTPLELWGDLDSISPEVLYKFKNNGVIIKKFPIEKDFTDSELIIKYLFEKKYSKIIIIAGLGGRKDHELTNLSLILQYKNIIFITEKEYIFYVDNTSKIINKLNKTISFIPFSKEVEGITLTGFKYSLNNYLLKQGDSRCMSNIITSNEATVQYSNGDLIGIINNKEDLC